MWSREHRCAIGAVRIVRDGDWIVRTVDGALDDDAQQRTHEDFANELRRAERSSERAVVLVDLVRAAPLSSAARAREQRFQEAHARLLRDHTAAIAFLATRPEVHACEPSGLRASLPSNPRAADRTTLPATTPSTFALPPCRWRAFSDAPNAIAWLEGQARACGMRGLPRGLRALFAAVDQGDASDEAAARINLVAR